MRRREADGETIVDRFSGVRLEEARAKDRAWRGRLKGLETAGRDRECIAARKAD
jgi:hypothetical protein